MARLLPALAAVCLFGCSGAPDAVPCADTPGSATGLTAGDRAALTGLDRMLAKAWLQPPGPDRTEAVLSLFAEDAEFYPASGNPPVVGRAALQAYWFDPEDQPILVESYRRRVDSVEGSAALAAIIGVSELSFRRGRRAITSRSHYIIHARRDAAHHWQITRMLTRRARES